MEPLTQNLTVADGQVGIVAAQITAGISSRARRLNLTFNNVGTQDETLVLTLSRNGGTARRIERVVLSPNEKLKIGGLALNLSDSLLAVTSNAASVDYVISVAPMDAPETSLTYDSDGRLKTLPYIIEQLDLT